MTAQDFTAAANYEVVVAPRWQAGMEYTSVGYITVTEAIESGDTWLIPGMLPDNNVQVLGCRVFGIEGDTNASPGGTIVVGDGTDADAYVTSRTWGDANGQFQAFGEGVVIGTSNQASTGVKVTSGGSVGTAASSGNLWVEMRYYCNGE